MEEPAKNRVQTSSASVQLAQLARLVNKTQEMNALTALVNMAAALTA